MMDLHLQPNEVAFYVDIESVKEFSLTETFYKLLELGYKPELTYYQWDNKGKPKIEPCALLHREITEDPHKLAFELEPEWKKLVEIFGDEAVNLELNDNPYVA